MHCTLEHTSVEKCGRQIQKGKEAGPCLEEEEDVAGRLDVVATCCGFEARNGGGKADADKMLCFRQDNDAIHNTHRPPRYMDCQNGMTYEEAVPSSRLEL